MKKIPRTRNVLGLEETYYVSVNLSDFLYARDSPRRWNIDLIGVGYLKRIDSQWEFASKTNILVENPLQRSNPAGRNEVCKSSNLT